MPDQTGSPCYRHDRCGHAQHIGRGHRGDPLQDIRNQDEHPQGSAYRAEHIRRAWIPGPRLQDIGAARTRPLH